MRNTVRTNPIKEDIVNENWYIIEAAEMEDFNIKDQYKFIMEILEQEK